MMRGLLDFLRAVFVSLEFLFILTVALLVQCRPSWFVFVGEALKSQADVLKWIPVIPIALCVFAFQLAWKLTVPTDSLSKELLSWPGYWRLKMRRNCSLILSVVTAALAAVLWIFSQKFDALWIGMVTILSFGLSLINIGCMFLASLTLREILDK